MCDAPCQVSAQRTSETGVISGAGTTVHGDDRSEYGFFCIAEDTAGNRETQALGDEATTMTNALVGDDGGCGCRASDQESSSGGWPSVLVIVLLLLLGSWQRRTCSIQRRFGTSGAEPTQPVPGEWPIR